MRPPHSPISTSVRDAQRSGGQVCGPGPRTETSEGALRGSLGVQVPGRPRSVTTVHITSRRPHAHTHAAVEHKGQECISGPCLSACRPTLRPACMPARASIRPSVYSACITSSTGGTCSHPGQQVQLLAVVSCRVASLRLVRKRQNCRPRRKEGRKQRCGPRPSANAQRSGDVI